MELNSETPKPKSYRPISWVEKRHFKGNWNYLNFYNKHVEEFFSHENEEFMSSKVTTSDVIYENQKGYKARHGSEWTSEDKNKFFKALSRYSIHRIEDIKDSVETKTEIEIYAYYHHLKKTLSQVRKNKVKQQVVKGEKLLYYENNNILVSYKEMPLCFEMSQRFTRFEEVQSYLIHKKESLIENDYSRSFNKFEPQYLDMDALKNVLDLCIDINHNPELFSIPNRTLIFLEYLIEQKTREFLYDIIYSYQKKVAVFPRSVRNYATYKTNPMENFLYNIGDFESKGIAQRDLFSPSKVFKLPPIHDITFVSSETTDSSLTIDSIPKYDITNSYDSHDKLDQRLFEAETTIVDEYDVIQGQNHEHILLTYFATFNKERSAGSMFTDEEMLGLTYEELKEYEDLEGWEFIPTDDEPPRKRARLSRNHQQHDQEEPEESEQDLDNNSDTLLMDSETDSEYSEVAESSESSDSDSDELSDYGNDNQVEQEETNRLEDEDNLHMITDDEMNEVLGNKSDEKEYSKLNITASEQELLTNFMYSYASYD